MKNFTPIMNSFFDYPMANDPDYLAIWVWLNRKAKYPDSDGEPYYANFKGETIELEAGQLITGRRSLSVTSGINESKVKRILQRFADDQLIDRQTDNRSSLITIRNFRNDPTDDQLKVQPKSDQWTTGDQQGDQPMDTLKSKESKRYKKEETIPENWQSVLDDFHKGVRSYYPNANISKSAEIKSLLMLMKKFSLDDYKSVVSWLADSANGWNSDDGWVSWGSIIRSTSKLLKKKDGITWFEIIQDKMNRKPAKGKHTTFVSPRSSQTEAINAKLTDRSRHLN